VIGLPEMATRKRRNVRTRKGVNCTQARGREGEVPCKEFRGGAEIGGGAEEKRRLNSRTWGSLREKRQTSIGHVQSTQRKIVENEKINKKKGAKKDHGLWFSVRHEKGEWAERKPNFWEIGGRRWQKKQG